MIRSTLFALALVFAAGTAQAETCRAKITEYCGSESSKHMIARLMGPSEPTELRACIDKHREKIRVRIGAEKSCDTVVAEYLSPVPVAQTAAPEPKVRPGQYRVDQYRRDAAEYDRQATKYRTKKHYR